MRTLERAIAVAFQASRKARFFSYSSQHGFYLHTTQQEAKDAVLAASPLSNGGSMALSCWGEISQGVVRMAQPSINVVDDRYAVLWD